MPKPSPISLPYFMRHLRLVERHGLRYTPMDRHKAGMAGADGETLFEPGLASVFLKEWRSVAGLVGVKAAPAGKPDRMATLFSQSAMLAGAYMASGGHAASGASIHVVVAGASNSEANPIMEGLHRAIGFFGPWSGVCRPIRVSYVGPACPQFSKDLSCLGIPMTCDGNACTLADFVAGLKADPRLVMLAHPGFSVEGESWLGDAGLSALVNRRVPVWLAGYGWMDLLDDIGIWQLGGGVAGDVWGSPWWAASDEPNRPWTVMCELKGPAPRLTPQLVASLEAHRNGERALNAIGLSMLDPPGVILGEEISLGRYALGSVAIDLRGGYWPAGASERGRCFSPRCRGDSLCQLLEHGGAGAFAHFHAVPCWRWWPCLSLRLGRDGVEALLPMFPSEVRVPIS